jgi:hypothetical protein
MENTQRQIKFRAWDGKQMFHSVSTADIKTTDLRLSMLNESIADIQSSMTLEQFTGLTHMNVEVYEGDIVTCEGGYEYPEGQFAECEGPRIVRWNAETFQFVVACDDCHDEIPLHEYDLSKIIGNINTTPGLIESGTSQKEA